MTFRYALGLGLLIVAFAAGIAGTRPWGDGTRRGEPVTARGALSLSEGTGGAAPPGAPNP